MAMVFHFPAGTDHATQLVSMNQRINVLEAQVQALLAAARVVQQPPSPPLAAAPVVQQPSNAPDSNPQLAAKLEPAAQHHGPPITYKEAFVKTGGDEEVKNGEEVSKRVREKALNPLMSKALEELFPDDTPRRGYSTVLINQEFASSFNELYQQALNALGPFKTLVEGVAKATGGKPVIPKPKGPVRAAEKAAFKYNDGTGVAWYRLTDLIRGTITYPTIKALYQGLADVDSRCEIKEFNDRYKKPMTGGYRDLQLVVRVEGHLCELQLNTDDMAFAKDSTGHRDYELIRELEAAVAEGNLQKCIEVFEWAESHLGIERQKTKSVLDTTDGNKLLHRACAFGHVDIAVCLLEQKCNVDSQDDNGDTSLHLAMRGGYERTVWALLNKYGAKTEVENKMGHTALLVGYLSFRANPEERRARTLSTLAHVAGPSHVASAHAKVENEIKTQRFNSKLLVDYANDGRVDKMQEELQNFADPDSFNSEDEKLPALVVAAQAGKLESVKLLLKYRPAQDSRRLALLRAAEKGQATIVKFFLSGDGSKPSQQDQEQALISAARHDQWTCVDLLFPCNPGPEAQRQLMVQIAKRGDLKYLQLLHQQAHLGIQQLLSPLIEKAKAGHSARLDLEAETEVKSVLFGAVVREEQHPAVQFLLTFASPTLQDTAITLCTNASVFELCLCSGNCRNVSLESKTLTVAHLATLERYFRNPNSRDLQSLVFRQTPDNFFDNLDVPLTRLGEALAISCPITFTIGATTIPVNALRAGDEKGFAMSIMDKERGVILVLGALLSALQRTLLVTYTFQQASVSCLHDFEAVSFPKNQPWSLKLKVQRRS